MRLPTNQAWMLFRMLAVLLTALLLLPRWSFEIAIGGFTPLLVLFVLFFQASKWSLLLFLASFLYDFLLFFLAGGS